MSRLAWKPHLRVAVVPPDDLFLLSEAGHQVLHGAAYPRVAPLLDGRWTASEIQAHLDADGAGLLDAAFALAHLGRLGLLREVDARTPERDAEAAFWELAHAEPADALRRTTGATVAVQSAGGTGANELARALGRAGIAVAGADTQAGLLVVVADDWHAPDLAGINRQQLDRGQPWVLVRLAGAAPWIGPRFVPGRTACLECLVQRLRMNQQIEMVLRERSAVPLRVPRVATPASLALAATAAAVALVQALAADASALDGTVTVLDIRTNEVSRHPVVRRPQCGACGPARARHRPGPPVATPPHLEPAPRDRAAGGRTSGAASVLDRFGHHVDPVSGIVRELFESSIDGYVHASAAQAFPMPRYDFRVLRENRLGRSGGKGLDPRQARASALCEALERYSGTWQGEEEVTFEADRIVLGPAAVDLHDVLGFSARQYAEREAWNLANDEPHAWVPLPFDDTARIAWTPLHSLTDGGTRHLPAAYCYYGHPEIRLGFCASDSNGCAAGTTATEAIAHGLLELVERDAAAIWWYNRVRRPGIDLDSAALPLLAPLRDLYARHGRTFEVLDLTTDLGIPVAVAVSARDGRPTEDIIYGMGCDFDPATAVEKALLEMNQSLFSVFERRRDGTTRYRTGHPSALRWFGQATRANQPYLVPAGEPRTVASIGEPSSGDWRTDLIRAVARLAARGLEVLTLDQTRPDVGLAVHRVVVPGLCHFWRRHGQRRLYQVPVDLGWLPEPRTEDGLNPFHIYF